MQEPFVERLDLPRGGGVDAEFAAGTGVVVVLVGETPRPHEPFKVRAVVVAEQIVALSAYFFAFVAFKDSFTLRQRGDQAGLPDAVILISGEQHPGVTRMHRELHHALAGFCQLAVMIECAEVGEQGKGAGQRNRIGLFQPSETFNIVNAACFECQNDLRQVVP